MRGPNLSRSKAVLFQNRTVLHLDQQHPNRSLRSHGMSEKRFHSNEGTGFDLDCLTAQVELAFSFDYVDQGRDGN
jgi:hypothetical protein